MGHKYKIMRPEHSEHPELTGRQVGDKCEIMRPEHSEHPELTGRQVGDKWETSVKSCGQALRASRAYWETSGRQMGDKCEIMRPEHSEHPELTGRQVGDKCETNGRQMATSIKSCGQSTESIQSLLGDKSETSGRQG